MWPSIVAPSDFESPCALSQTCEWTASETRCRSARRADWSRRRNPPLEGSEEAGYGFAYNPPYELLGLRISELACSVMAVKSPIAPLVQYLMLAAVAGVSLRMIIKGAVVESPAALTIALRSSKACLLRLLGRSATTGG
jgi:hypothetical protein